ncbi:MAG: hypothetical protein IJU50_10215 [Lachnospiraceae bacterium]|nr:hypothetical protein [Lachnospiraceae bacterium]
MTNTVFYYVDNDDDGKWDSMSTYDFKHLSNKPKYLTQYAKSKAGNGPESGAGYDGSPLISDGARIKFVTESDLQVDEDGYAYLTPATYGGVADRYYFYPDIGTYDCPILICPEKAGDEERLKRYSWGGAWLAGGAEPFANLAYHQCLDASELPVSQTTTTTVIIEGKQGFFIQAGAEAGVHIDIQLVNARAKRLGVENCDVSKVPKAEDTIDKVKGAIKTVSEYRSRFGAVQNRLEHALRNLYNLTENTTAADSRLRDTDFATEMVNFSNHNILQQAGTNMLAQANQNSNRILSLLQ